MGWGTSAGRRAPGDTWCRDMEEYLPLELFAYVRGDAHPQPPPPPLSPPPPHPHQVVDLLIKSKKAQT
jgi:hypothetical protein